VLDRSPPYTGVSSRKRREHVAPQPRTGRRWDCLRFDPGAPCGRTGLGPDEPDRKDRRQGDGRSGHRPAPCFRRSLEPPSPRQSRHRHGRGWGLPADGASFGRLRDRLGAARVPIARPKERPSPARPDHLHQRRPRPSHARRADHGPRSEPAHRRQDRRPEPDDDQGGPPEPAPEPEFRRPDRDHAGRPGRVEGRRALGRRRHGDREQLVRRRRGHHRYSPGSPGPERGHGVRRGGQRGQLGLRRRVRRGDGRRRQCRHPVGRELLSRRHRRLLRGRQPVDAGKGPRLPPLRSHRGLRAGIRQRRRPLLRRREIPRSEPQVRRRLQPGRLLRQGQGLVLRLVQPPDQQPEGGPVLPLGSRVGSPELPQFQEPLERADQADAGPGEEPQGVPQPGQQFFKATGIDPEHHRDRQPELSLCPDRVRLPEPQRGPPAGLHVRKRPLGERQGSHGRAEHNQPAGLLSRHEIFVLPDEFHLCGRPILRGSSRSPPLLRLDELGRLRHDQQPAAVPEVLEHGRPDLLSPPGRRARPEGRGPARPRPGERRRDLQSPFGRSLLGRSLQRTALRRAGPGRLRLLQYPKLLDLPLRQLLGHPAGHLGLVPPGRLDDRRSFHAPRGASDGKRVYSVLHPGGAAGWISEPADQIRLRR